MSDDRKPVDEIQRVWQWTDMELEVSKDDGRTAVVLKPLPALATCNYGKRYIDGIEYPSVFAKINPMQAYGQYVLEAGAVEYQKQYQTMKEWEKSYPIVELPAGSKPGQIPAQYMPKRKKTEEEIALEAQVAALTKKLQDKENRK